jgi:DNA polymerase-3 subunit alpha
MYSLLDGAADIGKLFKKAVADDMPAIAITDHGNMFGVFQFVAEAQKYRMNPDDKDDKRLKVKPIVGCEFYVVEDRHQKTFTKEKRDKRFHQLLLAKDEEGYQNLCKLTSLGYIEGLYSKWPRIDKELILKYHKGLIATSCCLGAEIPQLIMNKGEEEAEKALRWWLDLFGDDFYIELQRHNLPEQEVVNEVLVRFAHKYNIPLICTNDSHYVEEDDANAHDILLCVNTGDLKSTPIATDEEGGKGYRFGFPNNQFFFKSTAQMSKLFHDFPEALDNTNMIVDKVKTLDLKRDILLPNFPLPPEFTSQDDFLQHLTYIGAKEKYRDITPEVKDRLDFELGVIRQMGFAGYFLIVSDFIKAGRERGVFVGPGRGSAAGSAVAYCIGVTNIDPIKYNLLFERFLNPDRKSMPDIDTDFDDEGRQKVIEYVVEKYGKNQVAHIVTYGTMAAKSSIKDVSRVLDLPLADANMLAKLVPDKPGISLDRVLNAPLEGDKSLADKEGLASEDIDNCRTLRDYLKGGGQHADVLREALKLEGSVRNTGIHAAGIIIAPKDLTDLIPVCTAKDADLLVTQYEGKIIEDAGVIKMDFLGLKNLTIIRDCLKLIKINYDLDLDIETIPLDDQKTYELYQRGDTNGTFQFESAGMQKYLRELKPDKFEDLIAMNALYRPGPLAYIPNFINRKHGREAVSYDLPAMSEFLEETYGITVYQEQVMLLSQRLANFTKGDADVLRKAMGKKDRKTLDKLKPQFLAGCEANGHPLPVCEKVWTDWEAFAAYAFNKSHSTCYAWVAYQTAYLKAHYTSEYLAALMTHSKSIEDITFFLTEAKYLGIQVLGPSVNESWMYFTVNKKGQIRFGLAALKGVGEGPVEEILKAREAGPFESPLDFARRVNLRTVNRRVMESLVQAGGLDCFEGISRAQYFAEIDAKSGSFIEAMLRYGNNYQRDLDQRSTSLFGELSTDVSLVEEPQVPQAEDWGLMLKLSREKEVAGFYLSGHPLDDYKIQFQTRAVPLDKADNIRDREIGIAGIITEVQHRTSKKGTGFGQISIEDYSGSMKLALFGETYLKYSHLLVQDTIVFIKGKNAPRWNSKDEFEFRINSMQLLEGMGSDALTGVTLSLPIQDLTQQQINLIEGLCKQYPGNHKLKIVITDPAMNYSMPLVSKAFKVNASNEFLMELDRLLIQYKIDA